MPRIARESLLSLEAYARSRSEFRARAMEHKRRRTVHVGEHLTLLFEDELTVRYQIQEMLRIERIFEEADIRGELDAYNPLVPDGTNLKATMMIEYDDPAVRKQELAKLRGIEDKVYVQVDGHSKVYAIADEDLERENDEKTSSVHFLRFELDPAMIASFKGGAALAAGSDHTQYPARIEEVAPNVQTALVGDLA